MSRQELVKVECVILKETDMALRISQPGLSALWVPRSLLSHISKKPIDNWCGRTSGFRNAAIDMPQWLAKERGLDYE